MFSCTVAIKLDWKPISSPLLSKEQGTLSHLIFDNYMHKHNMRKHEWDSIKFYVIISMCIYTTKFVCVPLWGNV